MTYLLDVNALIAWHHPGASDHAAFHAWAARVGSSRLFTCAIVELGFLRISMAAFRYSLADAQHALEGIKHSAGGFVESCPPPKPPLGTTAATSTDAYLSQLAASAGLALATFDTGIPGATLIR